MSDERTELEEILRQARREYNPPPETPRGAIWAGIERARASRLRIERPLSRLHWFSWPILVPGAVIAVLIIGIWLGRATRPNEVPEQFTEIGEIGERISERRARTDETPGPGSEAPRHTPRFQHTALDYLSRTETLLTEFQNEPDIPSSHEEFNGWARSLLIEARLLLDSPAAEDQEIASLLQDIEVVLAQIAQLADDRAPGQRSWIKEDVEDRALLMRIRFKTPAGTLSLGI